MKESLRKKALDKLKKYIKDKKLDDGMCVECEVSYLGSEETVLDVHFDLISVCDGFCTFNEDYTEAYIDSNVYWKMAYRYFYHECDLDEVKEYLFGDEEDE